MSYLKAIALGALSGAVLYGLVVNWMTGPDLDAHIYETISSALDFHDQSSVYQQ